MINLSLSMAQIKEASAHGEDAWRGAGKSVGVQVWRIVQFKVHNRCYRAPYSYMYITK